MKTYETRAQKDIFTKAADNEATVTHLNDTESAQSDKWYIRFCRFVKATVENVQDYLNSDDPVVENFRIAKAKLGNAAAKLRNNVVFLFTHPLTVIGFLFKLCVRLIMLIAALMIIIEFLETHPTFMSDVSIIGEATFDNIVEWIVSLPDLVVKQVTTALRFIFEDSFIWNLLT